MEHRGAVGSLENTAAAEDPRGFLDLWEEFLQQRRNGTRICREMRLRVPVVTELVTHEHADENEARETDREAHHVDRRMELVAPRAAERGGDVPREHPVLYS